MGIPEFIKGDWERLPQSIRYSVLSGLSLIFLSWLANDMNSSFDTTLFGWDFRRSFFSAGAIIIFVGLFLVLWKQVISYKNLAKWRIKYPIRKLDKSFTLIWFKGRLMLFDRKSKMAYHIHPWETAIDLYFVGHGHSVAIDYDDAVRSERQFGKPINIKINDYPYVGQINTRR